MQNWWIHLGLLWTAIAVSSSAPLELSQWSFSTSGGGSLFRRHQDGWWRSVFETSEMVRDSSWDDYRLLSLGATSCGITHDHRAYCWEGSNMGGNSPHHRIDYGAVPADTEALFGFCLRTSGEEVWCARTAFDGEEVGYSFAKVDVSGLGGQITEMVGSRNHSCLLTSLGEIYCWGSNYAGKLGRGGFPYTFHQNEWHLTAATAMLPFPSQPVRAPEGKTFKAVSVFSDTGCALSKESDSQLYCWGRVRELGMVQDRLDDIEDAASAEAVLISGSDSKGFLGVTAGPMWGAVWNTKNEVYAWGFPERVAKGRPLRLGKIGALDSKLQIKKLFPAMNTICALASSEDGSDTLHCFKSGRFLRWAD